MSSDQTHKYFRKFVRVRSSIYDQGEEADRQRWNDGALRERYYAAPPKSPIAGTSTSR